MPNWAIKISSGQPKIRHTGIGGGKGEVVIDKIVFFSISPPPNFFPNINTVVSSNSANENLNNYMEMK